MILTNQSQIRASYDRVAAEYAARIFHELDGKPLDRALLEEVAARAQGLVCDLGCGPGHVAKFLSELGANVLGLDLSPRMIGEARRLSPRLRFEVADILDLPFDDASVGGVVAMYSLIHFDALELNRAAREIARVLTHGGILLTAFHRGSEVRHVDDLWNVKCSSTSISMSPTKSTMSTHGQDCRWRGLSSVNLIRAWRSKPSASITWL